MGSLLARLKSETRRAHDEIEVTVDVAASFSSIGRYRGLLERFYGFHASWDRRMEAALDDPGFAAPRRKLPLLVRDLEALGERASIPSLPVCADIPPMSNRAAALGSMYVLEGSTLGGTLLAKAAERRLKVTATTGCAYFRSYGPDVGLMWKRFGAYAEAAVPPRDHLAAVDAALATFATLQSWLRERVAA
jgi:heme oxygenase